MADEAQIPFWIQTIGCGLRAAWLAHVASTLQQATLSNLAAHTIWKQDITSLPPIVAGQMQVPDGPGLGVEVDESVVEKLRRLPPPPQPRRITTVVSPDGCRIHFSGEQQRHEAFHFREVHGFTRGIYLDTWVEDGSAEFEDLFRRCDSESVVETGARA